MELTASAHVDEHPEGDEEIGEVEAHEAGAARSCEFAVEKDGSENGHLLRQSSGCRLRA